MIDKIKALSDKSMIIIGIVLIFIVIIFLLVAGFINVMAFNFNRWIDFVFYFIIGTGFAFMVMAYKKEKT